MTTAQQICEILTSHLGCDPVSIDQLSDPLLLDSLRADSLDMIELTMSVEEACGVEIFDDEADAFLPSNPQVKPLSELVKLVDAKLAGKG